MKTLVNKMQQVGLRIAVWVSEEVHRVVTEKRGEVNLVSMIAITLVVLGAILGTAATVNDGVKAIMQGALDKFMELLGLK
ncbi:MAG: hypothetical protein K8T26_09425 [Lentisphaerae bacterium]|nr:hypothetical protein [Lentisphaerota bacterium]